VFAYNVWKFHAYAAAQGLRILWKLSRIYTYLTVIGRKTTVEGILKPVQELNCLIRKELNNNNRKNKKKNLRYFPHRVKCVLFLLLPLSLRGGRLYPFVLPRRNSP
jgi:hypothetical protein